MSARDNKHTESLASTSSAVPATTTTSTARRRASPPPPLPPRNTQHEQAHTYPPAPPPRATDARPHDATSAAHATLSTLYDQSPHHRQDHIVRRRRARNSCGLDPLHVVALIVGLGVVTLFIRPYLFPSAYWYSSSRSTSRFHSHRRRHRDDECTLPRHCTAATSRAPSQAADTSPVTAARMVWQTTFTLPSNTKGCYLITKDVERACAEGMKGVKAGIASLTIQHTSAALSLNENFDSTVRSDMTMAMDRIVPESLPWKHVDEGPDDSASHTKASLFGATITLPITDGRFNLGTWQGIYLCEFRAAKHSRRVVATILS